MRKIDRVKKRFVVDGLDVALNGRKRSRVYAKKVDGDFEAHLVALSCGDPDKCFDYCTFVHQLDGYSMNLIFESDRLYFRPLEESDLDLAVEQWTDPDVTKFVGG